MKALLAWWEGLCKSSKFMRFVDVTLRGIGQVTWLFLQPRLRFEEPRR